MPWTTPADIQAKLERQWDKGRLLTASLQGETPFPLSMALSHPGAEELSERFDEVRQWILALESGSRKVRGFGYEIVWTETNNRRIGKNSLPTSVVIPSDEDGFRLIGKGRDAKLFHSLAAPTLTRFPSLRDWVVAKPIRLLEHAEKWERLLAVLAWLRAHPQPGIYVRQMDIPGVDTKFIESNEGILTELFRAMVPEESSPLNIPSESPKSFAARFGFLAKPPLIRFRILDSRHYIQGLSDISAPLSQLISLAPPAKKVFITENDINGLSFPPMGDSFVLFGLGYGVESLSAIPWLRQKEIYYWGDIDTHGFAILDRLRAFFPQCRSLLMDRRTLLEHRDFWVEERIPAKSPLTRLTPEEGELYEDLRRDGIQASLRLEQERIGFRWVERALSEISE